MRPASPDSNRQNAFFLAFVIAIAAGFGWVAVSLRRPVVAEAQVQGRPVQIRQDGYVSSNTCRSCHPREYGTWHSSYHRTMTQVATRETVAADFAGRRVDAVPGRPMFLESRGDELWANFDDPDWDGSGDAPSRIERRVVMTTGSHHQQIYWYATGRSRVLGQLPAIWLTGEQRWIPRAAAVMRPPGQAYAETGAWNGICVACHSTSGRPGFETPFGSQPIRLQVADTRAAEFGISCEACHGPADRHVRGNVSPWRRYWMHLTGRPDETVVQPARLDPQRSSQVCGQCHSFWEFSDPSGERQANSRGAPYRPGDDLSATRFIVQPTMNRETPTMQAFLEGDPGFIRDIFWSDGMVRATGREYNGLIESPCFKDATETSRTMSCLSCHAMHQAPDDARPAKAWADDQLTPHASGNDACIQCHPSYKTDLTQHTKHAAESTGSSCYNCHMPFTTYGLLKTIRSHQISNPSVRSTLDTGRPNACNLCHLDKTLGWTAERLEQWYGTPQPDLSEDDRTVAAALLQLLKGDAGQRAIVAQSLGWGPAQQASGTSWLSPYLALLLTDPYDAVRFIASRSLRTLPEYGELQIDFLAPPAQRLRDRARALEIWRRTRAQPSRRLEATLLMNPDGTFKADAIDRLMRERNTRRVVYRE